MLGVDRKTFDRLLGPGAARAGAPRVIAGVCIGRRADAGDGRSARRSTSMRSPARTTAWCVAAVTACFAAALVVHVQQELLRLDSPPRRSAGWSRTPLLRVVISPNRSVRVDWNSTGVTLLYLGIPATAAVDHWRTALFELARSAGFAEVDFYACIKPMRNFAAENEGY